MRRFVVAAVLTAGLLALHAGGASATDPTPSPCPSPSASSGARVDCTAPVDPNQAAYDQLTQRLGGDVARALSAQRRLTRTLHQFAGIQTTLSAEISQEEAVIADLEQQIAKLDHDISDTEARIEVEKQQLSAMSRAIYREPQSRRTWRSCRRTATSGRKTWTARATPWTS